MRRWTTPNKQRNKLKNSKLNNKINMCLELDRQELELDRKELELDRQEHVPWTGQETGRMEVANLIRLINVH